MNNFIMYMLGKSQSASKMFDANVSRWTAIYGLIFAPTAFFTAIVIENNYQCLAGAIPLYLTSVVLFIPLVIEISNSQHKLN